ncbi:MAG: VWA domain-containing protein [Planctomycetes bacterium]|nr:VWA domain-containing protein [Planctomycetota bacterium]MBI3833816.1 VWA domain-containing protein [Planctomycetota bacterium]
MPISAIANQQAANSTGGNEPLNAPSMLSIFFPGSAGSVIGAWVLSLLFHAAVMATMFLIILPFSGKPDSRPPWNTANVSGEIDAPRSSIVAPVMGINSLELVQIGNTTSELANQEKTAEALRTLAGAGHSLTVGTGNGVGHGESGVGTGGQGLPLIGIGGGGGTGEPGTSGLPGGGPASPGFFGAGAAAQGVRSIVYVVDRSASMVGSFHAVISELRRSISALRRSQKFHVIFFSSEPIESPPHRLVNAVDAHKRELFDFLSTIEPRGGTKPERAIQVALALQPDIIYLLSDGVFDPSLLPQLNEWNKQRKTRIFTIAFVDPSGRELLEEIAHEHNGEFKFVSEDELP